MRERASKSDGETDGGESNECTYQVLGESLLVGDGARVGEPELVAEHRNGQVRVDPKAEVPVGLGIVCLGHQAEEQVLRRRLVVGVGRGGERA